MNYQLELKLTVSVEGEIIENVIQMLEARVNEMCHRIEDKDNMKIVLFHYCNITEQGE